MYISSTSSSDMIKENMMKLYNMLKRFYYVVFIIFLGILFFSCRQANYDRFAKQIVANDYPDLLCKSNRDQFRIYKHGTYSIQNNIENGWNVWWTDKGYSESTAFHIAKCDIKDILK